MIAKSTSLLAAAASGLIAFGARANDIEVGKEFYTSIKTVNPIVLDGDLSEWRGAQLIADPRFYIPKGSGTSGTLVNFEPYQGGTWTGPDDQTSNVRVVYDDDNVYLGVVVTDDYHENSANSAWNGDSVQLMIANPTRDTQVALYNYALGGIESALGSVVILHEAGPGGTEAIVVRDTATKRTTYEIKLPKESLGLDALGGGVQFGLGMSINDGDQATPGQKGWGGLGVHSIVHGKTPSETALVTLATANDIEPGKEFYFAGPVPGPITLDGALDEWTGVRVLSDPRFAIPKGSGSRGGGTLTLFEVLNGGSWTGPDDQTSAVRIAYDPDNVYFGFVVTDDYHENSANSAWNGDSVQLMIADATQTQQVGLYNYALGGVEAALGSYVYLNEAPAPGFAGMPLEGFVVRNTATKRTTYEIKLPKEALGLTELTLGTMFGLGMAINDGDQATPGQKGWGGLGAHALVFGKSPQQTALVTLGIGGGGAVCFLSAISPPTSANSNKFTFRGNDFEGSVVDAAGTKLFIDGLPAALVASPATLGATDFTHTLPIAFPAGTEHTFVIELKDTNGNVVTERSNFTAPIVYAPNLVGGGKWTTTHLWTHGTPQLDDVTIAETALAELGNFPLEDQIVVKTSYIHYDDNAGPPAYLAESQPFPLWDPINGGSGRADHDDFCTRSVGQINVINAGTCWFVCNSDDGFSLRIDGTEIGSAGVRGRTNTAMPVNLTAGPHNLELIYFERNGGAGLSLFVLKGTSDTEQAFSEDSHELAQAWLNPTDSDGDGMLDTYEVENGLNPAVNDAALDKDGDSLTNLVESQKGTRADKADTDSDGLNDNVESDTGVYVGPTDTGTDPFIRDTDRDDLADGVETNTGTYVSATNTGTDPNKADTDGDTWEDGFEIRSGSNPFLASSNPSLGVVWWSFDNATNPVQSADVVHQFTVDLLNGAAFSDDGAGRTGQAGDRALNLGTTKELQMAQSSEAEWLNISAAGDSIAFSFWQNLDSVTDSSAFWASSPSSNNGERGAQGHATWSDNNFYFDTVGCCDGTQRTSGPNTVDLVASWHHLVFQKNGATKQIWVDGVLAVSGSNNGVLPSDFYKFTIGADSNGGGNTLGLIDDMAVFDEALTPAQIGQLAAGATPASILTPATALSFTSITYNRGTNQIVLIWTSSPNKTYSLESSETLSTWPVEVNDSIPSGGPTTSYTINLSAGSPAANYYRVKQN